MFEKLFKYPTVILRYRSAPFTDERERYLEHREKSGCARETLLRIARETFWVARRLKVSDDRKVTPEQIQRAALRWSKDQCHAGRAQCLKWSRDLFILEATGWFRFLGWLVEKSEHPAPYMPMLEDFGSFLKEERGLSSKTIENYQWHADRFLHWYWNDDRSLADVLLPDVDTFLSSAGRDWNWSRVTVCSSARALRAFFRHAKMRGWSAVLADGIEGPRMFSHELLPIGPSWTDVQRFLADFSGDRPQDLRDRAMAMLFAIYGLRSSEVSGLQLEDIDWRQKRIGLQRAKRLGKQWYPLVPVVEEAIQTYLAKARPLYPGSEVFLTLKAPLGPISGGALYHMTSKRMRRLGMVSKKRGPHALRHACASHLVAEGLSLKEIGDHLGHRSSSATRIYAKVDLPHLREVAAFDCGGLL